MIFRVLFPLLLVAAVPGAEDDFLGWDARQAKAIALATRVNGQAGKSLDFRVTGTDRSYNYKLRATWMTPQVIRAVARLQQFAKALTAEETRKLVREAEAAGEIVIQVEIDPREGSGVIPNDWVALLGTRTGQAAASRTVRGASKPKLRDLPALAEREQRRRAREEAEAERRREAERAAAESQRQGVRIPGAMPLPGTDALTYWGLQ